LSLEADCQIRVLPERGSADPLEAAEMTLGVLSGTACLLVALIWALTPSVRRAEDGPMAEEGLPAGDH
jgi:hypothetical protein